MHIQNPLVACECITITEFASIFSHGRDDDCLPIVDNDDLDEDFAYGVNINVFNFYGPINGNVNGFKESL